jgi:hypothetical protein
MSESIAYASSSPGLGGYVRFFIFFKIDIQMELLALRNIIYRKIRTIIKVSKKKKKTTKNLWTKNLIEKGYGYIYVFE